MGTVNIAITSIEETVNVGVQDVGTETINVDIASTDYVVNIQVQDVALGTVGPAGTIQVGTVTTGAPGTPASVTNSGTEAAAVLDFTIPKGDTGGAGTPGVGLPAGGATGQLVAKASPADYDTEWVDPPTGGGGGGGDTVLIVSSDVTTTNNGSTYINIPALAVVVPAGSLCIINYTLLFETNSTADFSAQISADVAPGENYFFELDKAPNRGTQSLVDDFFLGGIVPATWDILDTATGVNVVRFSGVAYAGFTDTTFSFGFKQFAPSGTTRIKAGSFAKYRIQ